MDNLFLSEKELKVFRVLIALGEAKAATIAKKVGVSRTGCYDVLDKLVKKGFVRCVLKNRSKTYKACSELDFQTKIEQKIAHNIELLSYTKIFTSKLYRMNDAEYDDTEFVVLEGTEDIRRAFCELLDHANKEVKTFVNLNGFNQSTISFLKEKYLKERIKRGLRSKALVSKDSIESDMFEWPDKEELRDKKVLKNEVPFKFLVQLFGEYVAVFIQNKNNPILLKVKNKHVFEFFDQLHDALWVVN